MSARYITAHFHTGEFACRDGTPYPEEWVEGRLKPLCDALEKLRKHLGNVPITISSGYRTPAYNRKIGGAAEVEAHGGHRGGHRRSRPRGVLRP